MPLPEEIRCSPGIQDARFSSENQGRITIPHSSPEAWVLVAGIGNVLRCDDGFGPAVVRGLEICPDLPEGVDLIEVGIGGFGLVLQLFNHYQALVIVDAVYRGGSPGQLYELEMMVPDLASLSKLEAENPEMDMHQMGPGKSLVIARALGILPPVIHLIGCQPGETDVLTTDLSQPVQQAVPAAVQAVLSFLKCFDHTRESAHETAG